ncbi:MAG: flagellar protein FliT [Cycloclasticus sp.]
MNDLQQLQNIIADTKKLLLLAENNEWDAVVELEKIRGLAVESLFKKTPVIDAALLRKGIQFILEKNKILSQFSHSQQDSLRMEMSKTGHAHRAIKSYLST